MGGILLQEDRGEVWINEQLDALTRAGYHSSSSKWFNGLAVQRYDDWRKE